ncbi:MAG: hypothetical protein JW856_04300 [Dehalococcoidales bacterium]|nr:hypothetical protein [Dehalococcoidales bacterium]
MNRVVAWVVALLGVACLVMGIIFIVQANSGRQTIANELSPLTISQVNATYDTVKAKQQALAAVEEPKIQAGEAAPSTTYVYLSGQRTSLGLTKANIGLVGFIQTSGIVTILIGVGLLLVSVGSLAKKAAA